MGAASCAASSIRRGVDKRVDTLAGVWRFDLGDDPGEQHNLIREDPLLARALANELDARTPLYGGPAWLGQMVDVDYDGVPDRGLLRRPHEPPPRCAP